MEELNILETGAPERKLHPHAIAGFFCFLLLVLLLSDPAFTRSAENFFDLLLVPVAETGNAVYENSGGNIPDMQAATKNVLKELDLKKTVIPCPNESCLLTEVIITGQSMMLEDSFNQNDDGTENVMNFPALAIADENSMEDAVPENPSDGWNGANSNAADFNIQQNPLPEPASSDTEMQPDSKLPSGIQEGSGAIASNIIQDSTIQESIVQEPLPDGAQISSGNIAGSVISEEVQNPSVPEVMEPDSAISDVTDPPEMETGTEDDTAAETNSCFLMDEAGMLFGFLPEYAQMQDGYLALPAECTGIRSGAFSGVGAGITELYLPAGVAMIEDGALTGLDSLMYIDVDGSNPIYTGINGVLFDSTATVLLSFPAGRTDSYSLPAHVTQIASGAFTNTSLRRLDFRRCSSLFLGENIFGSSSGNGIVIAVPAESLPVYEDMLSSYAVILTI